MAGGYPHMSVPYRHPWREVTVNNLTQSVRLLSHENGLPSSLWPAAMRAFSDIIALHAITSNWSAYLLGRLDHTADHFEQLS